MKAAILLLLCFHFRVVYVSVAIRNILFHLSIVASSANSDVMEFLCVTSDKKVSSLAVVGVD